MTCMWCTKRKRDGDRNIPTVLDKDGGVWHIGQASGHAYPCNAPDAVDKTNLEVYEIYG